jgi:hypothetical protein
MRIECEPNSFTHDSTWSRAMASLLSRLIAVHISHYFAETLETLVFEA